MSSEILKSVQTENSNIGYVLKTLKDIYLQYLHQHQICQGALTELGPVKKMCRVQYEHATRSED